MNSRAMATLTAQIHREDGSFGPMCPNCRAFSPPVTPSMSCSDHSGKEFRWYLKAPRIPAP